MNEMIKIILTSDKTQYNLGEKIYLKVYLKNLSGNDMAVFTDLRNLNVNYDIYNEKEKQIEPLIVYDEIVKGEPHKDTYVILSPGEKHQMKWDIFFESVSVQSTFKKGPALEYFIGNVKFSALLDKMPGEYSIAIILETADSVGQAAKSKKLKRVFTGKQVSKKLKISIKDKK